MENIEEEVMLLRKQVDHLDKIIGMLTSYTREFAERADMPDDVSTGFKEIETEHSKMPF